MIKGVIGRMYYVRYKSSWLTESRYIWLEYPLELDGKVKCVYEKLGWANIEIDPEQINDAGFQ